VRGHSNRERIDGPRKMISTKRIRIGTRESALALYQANEVQKKLSHQGILSEIIEITSDGDLDLTTPLYEMGIQGIFTKSLDMALLSNTIDIAVHSCKDIPTQLAKGLSLGAVLERGTVFDCLVLPMGQNSINATLACTIATSSLRRKSQWLHRYPHHKTETLRGNIQTRLKKLDELGWHGAIFAQTALERLRLASHHFITLDWMLPSPAQGAIAIACRKDDLEAVEICRSINHTETFRCITAERDFLAALQGGCAVPIGAYAFVRQHELHFKGNIYSLDGKQKCEVALSVDLSMASEAGRLAAHKIRQEGAEPILKTFRPSF
jgi:hydroxymethylbilane synthase